MIDPDVDLQCCCRLFCHLVCDNSSSTNKKEPAEETSSYTTLEAIDRGTRLSLETNTIRGHIDSVASHLEQIRGFVREAVAPRSWTREGLALVSKMQKAASNQVELPSEIPAGLARATKYLELKTEKETGLEEIDVLLKAYYRLRVLSAYRQERSG